MSPLIILAALLGSTSALFVDLNEATQMCFLEEVPKDMLILAKWKAVPSQEMDIESLNQIGITLKLSDPQQFEFFSKDFPKESQYVFTSARGGEYRLCFSTNTSKWFGSGQALRFEVDIKTGSDATDYGEVAKSEHLSQVELSIRKLNDRVRVIRAEQDYQKRREIAFRETSETTNFRVLYWSVAQILLLVAVGAWQMQHLKSFFASKKLV